MISSICDIPVEIAAGRTRIQDARLLSESMRYPWRQRGMEELGAGGAHVIDTYSLLGGRTELNEVVSRGNFTQVCLDC